ncbi:MAG: serine/threonine protein kinase [Myxococcota bacterium]|nr:serine/threonine protein kinase [Myxococcota bacterium]
MADHGQLLAQTAAPRLDAAAGSDDPLQRALARVGATLRHKWRLDSLLGIGGMAAVYAATHRNGSRAAVKVLHPELSIDPFLRQRFLHEGYVANSVGHDGAVKVIDDDSSEDGSLFLVTELLEGETLEERRFRLEGRLPQDEVLLLADQLLDVLAAAHDHGIVHRDVKPENVFLTTAGQVKVLDFGIARLRPLAPAESVATTTGTTMGTPAFMAPEHARGRREEVDQLSDVWSCGALMFRLLSGCMVHEGDTLNEQLLSAMTKAAPRLATVAPDVSPSVAQLVDRALAARKDKRWPSARAMQDAVRQVFEELHGSPLTAAPKLTVRDAASGALSAEAGPAQGLDTAIHVVQRLRSGAQRFASVFTWRMAVVFLAAATGTIVVILGVAMANRPSSTEQPVRAVQSVAAPTVTRATTTELEAETTTPTTLAPIAAPPVPNTQPVAGSMRLPAQSVPVRPPAPPVAMPAPPRALTPPPLAAPHPPSAPPSAPIRSGCTPPYVVEPVSGKKQWKIECL